MSFLGGIGRSLLRVVTKVAPKILRKGAQKTVKKAAARTVVKQGIKGAPNTIPRSLLIRTKPIIPSTGIGQGLKTVALPKPNVIGKQLALTAKSPAKITKPLVGLFPPKSTSVVGKELAIYKAPIKTVTKVAPKKISKKALAAAAAAAAGGIAITTKKKKNKKK